jgi:hypothetical protein
MSDGPIAQSSGGVRAAAMAVLRWVGGTLALSGDATTTNTTGGKGGAGLGSATVTVNNSGATFVNGASSIGILA